MMRRTQPSLLLRRSYAPLLARVQDKDLERRMAEVESKLSAFASNDASAGVDTSSSKAQDENSKILSSEVLQSVIKIYASSLTPNHLLPWQRLMQNNVTGSGFVVDMKRGLIFTNAHVVANAEFVEVRKHGDHERFVGNVLYVGNDCDLAVIYVSDPSFWGNDVASLPLAGVEYEPGEQEAQSITVDALARSTSPFSGLPQLQTETKVVGYPMGGDQISITSGVVSRIDMTPYGVLDAFLVSIQIDAAINAGNSGGPALSLQDTSSSSSSQGTNEQQQRKKVIGLAFQSLTNADNIGYIIPVPVIAEFTRCFMRSVFHAANGARIVVPAAKAPLQLPPQAATRQYQEGFKSAGFFIQRLTNAALRRKYKVPQGSGGILVGYIFPGAGCQGVLFPGDVVLKIDGYDVANDGTIEFRHRERILISHILQLAAADTVRMDVLRDGVLIPDVVVPLAVHPRLVMSSLFSNHFHETPTYALLGGFVVTTVTLPLLLEWGPQNWFKDAPRHLVEASMNQFPSPEREEIVVVVQVLPHLVNKGYIQSEILYKPVRTVDGTKVRSFRHFVELVQQRRGTHVTSVGDDREVQEQEADDTAAAAAAENDGDGDDDELICFTVGEATLEDVFALPVKASLRADKDLMRLYNIPSLVQLSTTAQSTGVATVAARESIEQGNGDSI